MSISFIQIIQMLVSLSLLVVIHEMGHFLFARLFGVRVERFSLFFGKPILRFKPKRSETEYVVGWLPFGGYVELAGMIDESLNLEQMKQPPQPWEFRTKPAWQRLIIMIGGVCFNLIFACFIYAMILFKWGDTYTPLDNSKYGMEFNERAEAMGFRDGDKFVSVDGEMVDDVNDVRSKLLLTKEDRNIVVERDGEQVAFTIPFEQMLDMRRNRQYEDLYKLRLPFFIDSLASASAIESGLQVGDQVVAMNGEKTIGAQEITEKLQQYKGDTVTLTVLRAGATNELAVPINDEGKIGVMFKADVFQPRTRTFTLFEAIPAGVGLAFDTVADYWQQLKLIFQPKTKMYEELGGFIAIGNIFPSEWDWLRFWTMTAFLSVILAVMNILPIPGLDGGHALFTLWEMLTGRKPSDKFLEVMQYIGFAILFVLLIYANGNDIYRLFTK